MKRFAVAALLSIVLLPDARAAEPFVFENETARLVLGSDGLNKSLVEKPSGRDWLAKRPSRFVRVKKNGKFYAGTQVARDGNRLAVTFAGANVTAVYRVTTRPHYFIIELADLKGDGVEQISLGEIVTSIHEHVGGMLGVRWNDDFAVCWMGLSDRVQTTNSSAMVYSEFGMVGQKAALMAVPTARFYDVVQEVEHDCGLPSPTIDGQWAKTSDDVRRGYLFTDLTEANADETIRYAKLGEFRYIMVYSRTWSTSLGSYPINLKNFPRGEESLKAVIDKCHASGLKVGMHMLTSFVSKRDPLVSPKPDPRLLKDAQATLATDVDAKTREILSATPLDEFPTKRVYHGSPKQGFDVVIDDEIIHYGAIGGPDGRAFLQCTRGYLGTTASPHKAGAAVSHLAERYGSYLVDLRTSLKDELAERVAGVINRCGFDMIYFDGGEVNSADGPSWYWVSQQQEAICRRVHRDLFAQGSGMTSWLWHFCARGACDDFAAVAPKQYLDYHKIGDSWRSYRNNWMPAELGWWGFLDYAPHHPATSPDEVEFYAVRMLALDTPVSLETHLSALKANGRTDELLALLGKYERLRLARAVPDEIRERLREGEWHLTESGGRRALRQVRYDTRRVTFPGKARFANPYEKQPAVLRIQAVPTLASPGDAGNVVLFESDPAVELELPEASARMPGALAASVAFTKPAAEQPDVFLVGPTTLAYRDGKSINLLKHRALAVTLSVEGVRSAAAGPCPVLNVQLESGAATYREHYIDLDFSGEKTVIIPEPTTERMLPEFRPAAANYRFKSAGYSFNYGGIVAINLRWMRLPKGVSVHCKVKRVEALAESDAVLENPTLAIGSRRLAFPVRLATGDYLEYWGDGPARVFDRNGVSLRSLEPTGDRPVVAAGDNELDLTAAAAAPAKVTVISMGEPLEF